ncbi:beta-N-acetylhexosaminidase [bacterium]|nr:beta-N-acetylhexosaminidase [bacterium]
MNEERSQSGRVASTVMVGFTGYELTPEYEEFILWAKPAGVILFRRNLSDEDQLCRLCEKLHQLGKRSDSEQPFLIALDQEGGLVNRAEKMLLPLPSALSLGTIADPGLVYDLAAYMASRLKSWGIDLNFAPVVDLYYPHNRQLLTRSYSADPQMVVTLARAFIRGCLDNGIIPCIKHYPGLGQCLVDTHLNFGVVKRNKAALEAADLRPFRALVRENVPMIMASHATFPALAPGADLPASLSPELITDLLRDEHGFDGVCVSDDLEMKAVSARWSPSEAALMALGAGCDLLLICHDFREQVRTINLLEHALTQGLLSPERLEQACARLTRLKTLINVAPKRLHYKQKARLARTIDAVFDANFRIVRDQSGLLPLTRSFYDRVLVVVRLNRPLDEHENAFLKKCTEQFCAESLIVSSSGQQAVSFAFLEERDHTSSLTLMIGHGWQEATGPSFSARHPQQTLYLLTGDPAEMTLLPTGSTCIVLTDNSFRAIERGLERIL